MSKSLGNFITAEEAIQKYGGADIVRLWVASENIHNDVRFSEEIMRRMVDAYRRIRNSLRFLLGNLDGFAPRQALKRKDLFELDKLMLHRLHALFQAAGDTCDAYEFYKYHQLLQNFCASDLSAFYFDIIKDRLYADGPGSRSRLAAQTVLWHVLRYLVRFIAPVLMHTAEETWGHMRQQGLIPDKEMVDSVHLASWIPAPAEWRDQDLAQVWDELLTVRTEVLKKLEEERNQKKIRHSYEAKVHIKVRGAKRSWLAGRYEELAALFVVSSVELEDAGAAGPEMVVSIESATGNKCERCWRILPSVGRHEDHPGLCTRCREAVTAAQAKEEKNAKR